jgi:Cdc6-like AAA superfamily ATPase
MGAESSSDLNSNINLPSLGSTTFETIDEIHKLQEIKRMDSNIRNRLQQGVHYNMKILLCGARATGKTMLWKRFQGQAFAETVSFPVPQYFSQHKPFLLGFCYHTTI